MIKMTLEELIESGVEEIQANKRKEKRLLEIDAEILRLKEEKTEICREATFFEIGAFKEFRRLLDEAIKLVEG
jgi:hypothetical protein